MLTDYSFKFFFFFTKKFFDQEGDQKLKINFAWPKKVDFCKLEAISVLQLTGWLVEMGK